ncbi:hypothetical protein KW795_02435 [Candidatus Microgenomates bacterium]|nr:hypothetical protein [Candidatus Microgenomates bacterium]
MYKRIFGVSASFLFALLILCISIFSSSQVVYVFGQTSTPAPILGQKVEIDYLMPYAGKVSPDSPLWTVKALRDKLWLTLTLDPVKKIQLLNLLADKRVQNANELVVEDKSELGVSTLTKAEKYLEQAVMAEKDARSKKSNTAAATKVLAMSILKHRQILENILAIAPEDAKPVIVKTIDLNKSLFNQIKMSLNEQGLPSPENPFKD